MHKFIEKLQEPIRRLPHPVRWIVVATVGGLCIVIGIIEMILPGPGFIMLIAGFSILAIEFTWAEIVLHRTVHHANRFTAWLRRLFGRTK